MNMQETNVVVDSLGREQRFEIGSQALEAVRDYIYLGQVGTASCEA